VIIVGDFDVNEMEKKVKKIYSTIPVGTNLAQKEEYPIPAMTEPLFENIIDPDVKYQALKVFHRHPYPGKDERYSMNFYTQYFMKQIITSIIYNRFSKATEAPDSPAEIAIAVTHPYLDNFYTTLFTLTPKEENQLADLLKFYATEVQRLIRHGFTKEEFEMAKANVWQENRLDEEMDRSDVDNESIVDLCVDNFTRNKPMVYAHDLLKIKGEVLNDVTFEQTLAYLPQMMGGPEKIYSYTAATDKTHLLPSKEKMKEILAEVEKADLEPGYLTFKKMNLVTDMEPGSVKKSKALKNMKGELWTLSNGAKVYWLPVEPVKSSTHFTLEARYDTGFRTARQNEIAKTDAAGTYISRELGFGDCTNADISKDPKCGKVRAYASCSNGNSNMTVMCGKNDVETGLAMFYNYMTRPYFNNENALTQYKEINLRGLSREQTPVTKFNRERKTARYGEHPWIEYADSTTYKDLDMAFVEETFYRLFGNPENLTLYICTDVDKSIVQPLVEKYVESLEKKGSFKKVKDIPVVPVVKGEVIFDKTYPLTSAPKVDIEYQFLTNVKENLETKVTYDVLDYVMSLRYLFRIREERGGTYTVSFSSDGFGHKNLRQSVISFQTRPEMEEILLKDCQDLIDDLCINGPTANEMDEAAKYLIKANNEKKQRNKNLINVRLMEMKACIASGLPLEYDYEKAIREVTAQDVQKLAKKINNGTRFISIYREK
jgi:zinc protease